MEENFSWVVSCAVKGIFLAADDARVPYWPEIYVELLSPVVAHHLVEDFADAVDGLGLQDDVNGRVDLREFVATESRNRWWNKDLTFRRLSSSHGVNHSKNINVNRKVRITLSKGRKDTSQVDNVGDLMLLNKLHVAIGIRDIELLELAREVELLSANVAGNHIFSTKFFADGSGERDPNLSLASS